MVKLPQTWCAVDGAQRIALASELLQRRPASSINSTPVRRHAQRPRGRIMAYMAKVGSGTRAPTNASNQRLGAGVLIARSCICRRVHRRRDTSVCTAANYGLCRICALCKHPQRSGRVHQRALEYGFHRTDPAGVRMILNQLGHQSRYGLARAIFGECTFSSVHLFVPGVVEIAVNGQCRQPPRRFGEEGRIRGQRRFLASGVTVEQTTMRDSTAGP